MVGNVGKLYKALYEVEESQRKYAFRSIKDEIHAHKADIRKAFDRNQEYKIHLPGNRTLTLRRASKGVKSAA